MVIIIFAFCVLLPVMLTGGLFIANLQKSGARQRDQLVTQLNGQISNALDLISEEIEGLGKLHTSRWDILRILRREYSAHDDAYVADCRLMADLIGVCMQTNDKIYRMTFVSRSGEVFTQFAPPYLSDMRTMRARIDQLKLTGGQQLIFKPAQAGDVYGESRYIPYVLRLKDPHTWITVGYLAVDLKYSAIENLLNAGEAVQGGAHVMILDGKDVVYSSFPEDADNAQFLRDVRLLHDHGDTAGHLNIGGEEEYAVSIWRHEATGWDILTYTPRGVFLRSLHGDIVQYAIWMCGILLFVSLISRRLFSRFLGSVRILRNAMLDAREGRIKPIDASEPNTRELATLYESYNDMADKIIWSIQNEYESRLLQKKTEMDMLLSQINPHFLYNTLNLIRSVVQVGENDKADEIILCLSSMLRYSSRPSTFVTVLEEIEQVRNYLTIQMLRFPDTIKTQIEVEPELYGCRMIKFMLQPLVENAFKHGLEMIKRDRELRLTVSREGEDARISIRDNGMGIPPEKLEALRRELARISNGDAGSAAEARSLGIGLINVHKRLYYTYGSRYGIALESEYGVGTVVVMTMPVRMKEEDIDADSGC